VTRFSHRISTAVKRISAADFLKLGLCWYWCFTEGRISMLWRSSSRAMFAVRLSCLSSLFSNVRTFQAAKCNVFRFKRCCLLVYFAVTVASKFVRFKSGWPQHVQENVYKTRITDLDDHKHRIRTECAKLDHAVIASAFQLVSGREVVIWALLLILTLCSFAITERFLEFSLTGRIEQLQADIPVWFSCSCQLWRCAF